MDADKLREVQTVLNKKALEVEALHNFDNGIKGLYAQLSVYDVERICCVSSCQKEAVDKMYHKLYVLTQGI